MRKGGAAEAAGREEGEEEEGERRTKRKRKRETNGRRDHDNRHEKGYKETARWRRKKQRAKLVMRENQESS